MPTLPLIACLLSVRRDSPADNGGDHTTTRNDTSRNTVAIAANPPTMYS